MARCWQFVRRLLGYDHSCVRVEHLLGWSLGGACSRILLILLIGTWHACIDINRFILHARILLMDVGRHLLLQQWLEVPLPRRLRVVRLCLGISSLIKAISIEPRLVIVWQRLSKHDLMCRWHHFYATSEICRLAELLRHARLLLVLRHASIEHLLPWDRLINIFMLSAKRTSQRRLLAIQLVNLVG